MEKKLYWLIESRLGDLSLIISDLETGAELIKYDLDGIDEDDKKESWYMITPVWYTDEEYEKLPESDG